MSDGRRSTFRAHQNCENRLALTLCNWILNPDSAEKMNEWRAWIREDTRVFGFKSLLALVSPLR
jgi:hypothetical protein